MFEDRKPDCMSFDSGSTGQSGQPGGPYTYSYSYPSPGEGPGRQPRKPERRGPGLSILTVLLCVVLSFAAGVGGATMAFDSLRQSLETQSGRHELR